MLALCLFITYNCDLFPGENCSALVRQTQYSPPSVPFTCDLEFTAFMFDIGADQVFRVFAAFDSERGEKH